MFIQLSRVPQTLALGIGSKYVLKLRTMLHETVRPAKRVCNCEFVAIRRETSCKILQV